MYYFGRLLVLINFEIDYIRALQLCESKQYVTLFNGLKRVSVRKGFKIEIGT